MNLCTPSLQWQVPTWLGNVEAKTIHRSRTSKYNFLSMFVRKNAQVKRKRTSWRATPPHQPVYFPDCFTFVQRFFMACYVTLTSNDARVWASGNNELMSLVRGWDYSEGTRAATPTAFSRKEQIQPTRQAPQRLGPPDRPGRRTTSAVFSPKGGPSPADASLLLLCYQAMMRAFEHREIKSWYRL